MCFWVHRSRATSDFDTHLLFHFGYPYCLRSHSIFGKGLCKQVKYTVISAILKKYMYV